PGRLLPEPIGRWDVEREFDLGPHGAGLLATSRRHVRARTRCLRPPAVRGVAVAVEGGVVVAAPVECGAEVAEPIEGGAAVAVEHGTVPAEPVERGAGDPSAHLGGRLVGATGGRYG